MIDLKKKNDTITDLIFLKNRHVYVENPLPKKRKRKKKLYSIILSNPFIMLINIAVILIVLWLVGLVTSYTLGGLIHILLVIAIIFFLIRIIRGENPLR